MSVPLYYTAKRGCPISEQKKFVKQHPTIPNLPLKSASPNQSTAVRTAECHSGLRLRDTLLPDLTFPLFTFPSAEVCYASLPRSTTRHPDSCVSLRFCLHDTQPLYSISRHTTPFWQWRKGRATATAVQVSGWKQSVPTAYASGTPCFQI